MNELHIPEQLKEQVNRALEPGERVEWLGQPIPHYFTRGARAIFAFGVLWTAFAIFFTIGYTRQERHVFAILPGLPFLLIGIGLLSTPIWYFRSDLKTVYAITNKRAITIYKGRSGSITQSYYPDFLQDIYTQEKKDGTGDVIISCQALRDSWHAGQTEPLGILQIRNPKEVEKKLKKLAEQSSEADVEQHRGFS